MIVFVAGDNEQISEEIYAHAISLSLETAVVDASDDDALSLALQTKTKAKGVYIMSEQLARGFDMKFAKEAFVLIYARDFYYDSSVIEQMVGRANRHQGVQCGRVFAVFANATVEVGDWEFYKQRE